MVCKIIWSPLALKTYIANLEYLEKEWSVKEVANFTLSVQKKLELLSIHPKIGIRSSKRKSLRKVVIHKRMILIYRYKAQKKEIEIVQFWNTYQKRGFS